MFKIEFFLLKKYLRFDSSQPFISISAILAFIGVFIGVAILIISMALMNGLGVEFQKRLFTMNYPLTVFSSYLEPIDDKYVKHLEQTFPNLKFSPYIKSSAIVQYGENMKGVLLVGVDFQKEKLVNKVIAKYLKEDNVSKYSIMLGKALKNELTRFSPQEIKKLKIIFINSSPIGLGSMPTVKRYKYLSDFSSGLVSYDKLYAYVDINSLKTIKHTSVYDGVHIYSNNAFEDKKRLESDSDILNVLGWWEQNGNFFQAQQMEKKSLFIILMSIILVASLNIISSLMMTIMSRRKEIALLLSLGMSKMQIKKTFFLLGVSLGSVGIIIGIIVGLLGVYVLGNYNIVSLPSDVYGSSKLPLDLDIVDFISIIIGSFIIVFISSWYPASKASKIDISNVLRYE